MSDLADAARLRLIRQALEASGEPATAEALEWQFRYETGRKLDPNLDPLPPWERTP